MLLNSEQCEVRECGMVLLALQVSQGHKGAKQSEERERHSGRTEEREPGEGTVGWVRATVPALSVSVLHIMACASLDTAATGN